MIHPSSQIKELKHTTITRLFSTIIKYKMFFNQANRRALASLLWWPAASGGARGVLGVLQPPYSHETHGAPQSPPNIFQA